MRQAVTCNGVRISLQFIVLASQSVLQVVDTLHTGTGNSLISGVYNTLDAVLILQRLQSYHSLNRGAVGIRDNALVPLDVLGIDFRNYQRYCLVHSPLAAVVYDRNTVCCRDGSELSAGATARTEEGDIDRLVEGMLCQFFHGIFLTLEHDLLSCGTAGCHQVNVLKRKISFFQNFQERGSDYTRRPDYCDVGFSFHCFFTSYEKTAPFWHRLHVSYSAATTSLPS